MSLDEPVPCEVKVIDTASLLALEETAMECGLSQRLPPVWVAENVAEGHHYLRPALWHELSHRPTLPRQLRCFLLVRLRTGEQVQSLLDVLPDDFSPLPKVTSRDEAMRVAELLDSAQSVAEWEQSRDQRA
ncbi:hypothetical protein [Actinoallomurus sp. CA-150999]|uniref:hypothetical protein n=1 Tax=Actinoallomurus sp. CA-150999 TaxID=3239887 RepID=UPI003D8FEDA4